MAIKDFLAKELRMLREGRVRTAAETGVWETFWFLLEKTAFEKQRETPIWEYPGWDIAVVLDATRLDLMQEAVVEYDWLPNNVPAIWSVGSASPEWIGETFRPRYRDEWNDVGYVTANPFSCKPNDRAAGAPSGSLPLEESSLGYLDEVWRDQWQNDPLSTVPPEIIFNRALWAWHTQDIDRLIIHAMQPHAPFRARPEWFGKRENLYIFGEPDKGNSGQNVFKDIRDGIRSEKEVWAAYLDNLHWALEAVDEFRKQVDANILVTSDHGNGLGEYGVWSHPPNNSSPVLRRVPAIDVEGVNSLNWDGNVIGNPPVTTEQESTNINKQLSALGYR